MTTDLMRCSGVGCPCRDTCARFLPFVPDTHPVHVMEFSPFEHDAGACPDFVLINQQEQTQHATA